MALGTATDPYQPAEGRFRLTRACLVELDAAWTPYSIVTRGPLVVRDIDVLQEASGRAGAEVFLSLPTLDERVWRTTEPGTAPPASRLEAVRRLAAAGIDVGVGIAPILPGLSDDPRQLEAVVRAARAAGARTIWASVVHLRPGVREHFLEALARDWPEEVARYEALFASRAYLGAATTGPILEPVRRATAAVPSPRRRPPTPRRQRPRQTRSRSSSEATRQEGADPRRRIAPWPTRSPASSRTTTRSFARAFASPCRARRASA